MIMPASGKTTTIRMDSRALKRIDTLARAMSRSRAWVIKQALDRYLDYEEWFVREVKEALEQARSGNLMEHETVLGRWKRKRETSMDTSRKP